mmetsp:Transcript_9411/g.27786  ORF Transcript_9411/g.27786 Transcript_9411/m.27786 type:complete len:206 (-) Transcript_9411:57-674(-)
MCKSPTSSTMKRRNGSPGVLPLSRPSGPMGMLRADTSLTLRVAGGGTSSDSLNEKSIAKLVWPPAPVRSSFSTTVGLPLVSPPKARNCVLPNTVSGSLPSTRSSTVTANSGSRRLTAFEPAGSTRVHVSPHCGKREPAMNRVRDVSSSSTSISVKRMYGSLRPLSFTPGTYAALISEKTSVSSCRARFSSSSRCSRSACSRLSRL